MNIFDTTVAVIPAGVGIPNADDLDPGEEASIELIVSVPMALPISTGPGQGPLTFPVGVIRFSMGREMAIPYLEKALEAAKNLPKKSDVLIASDLSNVDQAHAAMERLKQQ